MGDKVIGIDLGGTKIAAVLLDATTETVIRKEVTPTQGHEGDDAVLMRIAEAVRRICIDADVSLADIRAVGVGLPATIDYDTGRTLLLPNIPGEWYGKPVLAILQAALGIPVWLINDARAFTLAEATLGAGRDASLVACFTLGTGIGGGIALNGQLLLGQEGSAGEFGHHTIDYNGLPDGSGTPGALESFASGPAIATMGIKAVMQGIDTIIGDLVNYDLNRVTPRIIMQAAEAGDAVAQNILTQVGTYIGVGMANVVTLLNPHCIVIGGGVAQLGEWIMAPIWTALRRYNHTANLDRLRILPAALGEDAGAIGAALWAYQQQRKQSGEN
ncbi:MAG: ROK family protein [Anaerolineae bacterium]